VTAAVGKRDGQVVRELMVWDGSTGQALRTESSTGEQTLCIALSADGSQLVEARALDESVDVVVSGATDADRPSRRLVGLSAFVGAVAFAPDGRRIAAATDAGDVYLWDETGSPVHPQPLHGPGGLAALAFSPDGTRLAGASRERVQVWEVASGQEVIFLRGAPVRPGDNGFNPRIVWSHDGTRLAGSNWNRVVSLWDATDLAGEAGKATLTRHAAARALDFYLDHADLYAGTGHPFAASFHRRRVEALDPPTPGLRRLRGDFHARCGRWDAAAADYTAAFAGGLPPQAIGLQGCAALLLERDPAGYGALRARSLRALGASHDPTTLHELIGACGLAPLPPAEAAQLVAAARRWVEENPKASFAWCCLGLAHLRANDWEEAARCARRSLEGEGGFPALAWMTIGLMHLRKGEPEAARPWLEKADAWLMAQERELPPNTGSAPIGWDWVGYLTVRALRREAASRP
jgi:hypothetical protein